MQLRCCRDYSSGLHKSKDRAEPSQYGLKVDPKQVMTAAIPSNAHSLEHSIN